MHPVDPNRLKIWQALSSFFLDTELEERDFDHIARVIIESGYTKEQVHNVLWAEVYPVLQANLRSVAGGWAGWSDDWLLEHLWVSGTPAKAKRFGAIAREIAWCWAQVANRLASDQA